MANWQIEKELAEYHKIAKAADQKMRRLEAEYKRTSDDELLRYAYSRAQRDIKSIGGNKRFDITLKQRKETETQAFERDIDFLWRIRQATKDAKRFIEAPTSSVSGFTEMYKERAEKFNEAMGTDFTVKEFRAIMETGLFNTMQNITPGYRTGVKIIEGMMKNNKVREKIISRRRTMGSQSVRSMLSKYEYNFDSVTQKIINNIIK